MKKGIVVCTVLALTLFFGAILAALTPAPSLLKVGGHAQAQISAQSEGSTQAQVTQSGGSYYRVENPNYEIAFPNKGFSPISSYGVFIIRPDESVLKDIPSTDTFWGYAELNERTTGGFGDFDFEPIKEIGGVWYTAEEYAELLGEPSHNVGTWFEVDMVHKPDGSIFAMWYLRIKSSAGKYGIRAKAMMDVGGNRVEIPNDDEKNPSHFYFVILYGDEFRYIRCVDDEYGATVWDANKNGRDLRINVSANIGAMYIEPTYIKPESQTYITTKAGEIVEVVVGELERPLDIYWADVEAVTVKIELNGKKVSGSDEWYQWNNGGIDVKLPKNLPGGRYLVTFAHEFGDGIIGTYTIDKGNPVPKPFSAAGIGILFAVIGVLMLFGGVFLISGPRIIYAINEKRYRSIDDKVYQNDPKSIRLREKRKKEEEAAIKSGEKTVEKDRSSSFTARIADYRQKREKARAAGMSMEEFQKEEKERSRIKEVSKHSISELRRAEDGGVQITEKPVAEKADAGRVIKDEGGVEFELLDSVRQERIFKGENEKEKDMDEIDGLSPIRGGILSRIRDFNDENKN